MSESIDRLLDLYESRRITRRQLAGAIAALAAGASSRLSAQVPAASQAPAAQGATLNHASLAVSDVDKSAEFYQSLLGLTVVSRPGNGGINMGLGTSFLGVYKLANPGTVNHICIGVNDYDPDAIAAKLQARGVQARVDRNPANRTGGGDQLYFTDPDGTRVQLSANGYQG